jgi:hypothetical protein
LEIPERRPGFVSRFGHSQTDASLSWFAECGSHQYSRRSWTILRTDSIPKASSFGVNAEFALKHRYAMVLHTDQRHPHVHLVVKAVSEEGRRLNIRKVTLRAWRRQFAAQLRAQGVAANATERAVRGETRPPVRDGVFRASQRGESTYLRRRRDLAAERLALGTSTREPGAIALQETRRAVVEGWHATVERLLTDGHGRLAEQAWTFIGGMLPPQTEQQRFESELATRVDKHRQRERDAPTR